MNYNIRVVRFPAGQTPSVLSTLYAPASNFLDGVPVFYNALGEIEECPPNNPQVIAGVAAVGGNRGYGDVMANSPLITNEADNFVSIYNIKPDTNLFSARVIDGSGNYIWPQKTLIGNVYGLRKTNEQGWVVDISIVSDTTVKILNVDVGNKLVYFKITADSVAEYPYSIEVTPDPVIVDYEESPFTLEVTPEDFTVGI